MKDSRKILTSVLSTLALLVIAVLVFVDLFADKRIEQAVETAASNALTVGVDVNSVDLRLTKGKLVLHDLTIGNPQGYQQAKMADVRRTRIYMDSGSLLSEEVRIKDIKIEDVEFVLEQKGLSNNLQQVLEEIRKRPREEQSGGKQLHIDMLRIYGVRVKLRVPAMAADKDVVTLDLDPIVMENIGSKKKLDTEDLTAEIFLAIIDGVVEQGGGTIPSEVLRGMSSTMTKMLEIGKGMLSGGMSITGELLNGTGQIGKSLLEGAARMLPQEANRP